MVNPDEPFFLCLFLKTDFSGSDKLRWAVNILFRIDPSGAIATMLTGHPNP